MKKIKFTKENIALSLILILSLILNLANLNIEGYANQYYAAGVKSMTLSLKNFFFISFDPASFVSIDKPPLGFWIQAIFAKIFGFSGWSIILPQAIAGVVSVGLIYVIVKRSFGTAAGLISAICLAVTPVFVAVSRNNTCDNLLVLTLLLACLVLSKAAEKGKLKYLLISLAIIGIGFNIKMLQAYMIIPAIYITYLLSNAVSFKKRIVHLMAGTIILILVSLSWAFIVDLIPEGNRPYVGSSTNNSVMELIIGHNGLERLGIGSKSTQGGGAPGGMDGKNQQKTDGTSSATKNKNSEQTSKENGQTGGETPSIDNDQMQGQPPSMDNGEMQGTPPNTQDGGKGNANPPNGDGKGPGGMPPGDNGMQKPNGGGMGETFGGQEVASITRLFSNNSLSDQIIWLFPLAVFGFIAAAIKEKLNKTSDNKRKLSLVLWSMWLLPEFIYFSFIKGLFHPYYLTMLAPPISALVGIGVVSMWKLYNENGWKSWILPVALIADGLTQILILSYYYNISNTAKILTTIVAVLCIVSSIILAIVNLRKNKKDILKFKNIKFKKSLVTIALMGLLITPLVCSATTIFYPVSGTFPSAGLSLMTNKEKDGFNMGDPNSGNTKLIEFLKSHKTNEKYLLVTSSTNGYASDIIINTGESVMALGGFFGTDKVITLDEFKKLVNNGEIRYVMVGGMGGNSSSDIMNWVKENGKVVSESEWKDSNEINSEGVNKDNNNKENSNSNTKQFGQEGKGNSEQLYDLKNYTDTTTKK
ncbi:glycosyltransferase family 39 protein [Clostridium botulinum]|uniref:Dolichyl-phosphate-mannose-protein mannosyltransferase n=1 Tax=Clostridium botulinum (strain Hall / ATCC 3502 / NCTC 13319 / Type A) TaxID=441771 RepID=A5HYJ2_CLOBH|nr:glycosyltransferase family 39 protein [Clostridium botulinum]NFL69612.1 glycosyltransferase family 39 protein [Clostridium botulinum]NFQ52001.1 glycosyltransferase family 39 protein [Clostridium botulinum]NFT45787.1 glycosyltransferase family 39 protein [Clostridium botulinum]QGT43823.1 Undecaprenyl phosphate-alpha-4-amino-4-deoxy-L-arabinose arabinosyl transferase [Clostridium botulinum]RUT52901.1 dolichyl-phosphate-mannose-mannosyltransferase family protein [Clostridium botulinum]